MNGTNLMPVRVIESMQTGHRKPIKVLSGKRTNALRDEMSFFMDEDMGTAVPPNAAFLRKLKYEGIESLAERCGGNPVIRSLAHTLLFSITQKHKDWFNQPAACQNLRLSVGNEIDKAAVFPLHLSGARARGFDLTEAVALDQ